MNQENKISVLKAISWRLIATSITMVFAYSVTGRLDFMTSIGLGDIVIKMTLYFLHERAWEKRYFRRFMRFLASKRVPRGTLSLSRRVERGVTAQADSADQLIP
jgi:uncharacterized membrane protein